MCNQHISNYVEVKSIHIKNALIDDVGLSELKYLIK